MSLCTACSMAWTLGHNQLYNWTFMKYQRNSGWLFFTMLPMTYTDRVNVPKLTRLKSSPLPQLLNLGTSSEA